MKNKKSDMHFPGSYTTEYRIACNQKMVRNEIYCRDQVITILTFFFSFLRNTYIYIKKTETCLKNIKDNMHFFF